jgi:hypothetical protein
VFRVFIVACSESLPPGGGRRGKRFHKVTISEHGTKIGDTKNKSIQRWMLFVFADIDSWVI